MLKKLYKWFWSQWGGRQWTSIMRDSSRNHILLWLLGAGVIAWLSFLLGVLVGHLFWGKEWKVGEGRQRYEDRG